MFGSLLLETNLISMVYCNISGGLIESAIEMIVAHSQSNMGKHFRIPDKFLLDGKKHIFIT